MGQTQKTQQTETYSELAESRDRWKTAAAVLHGRTQDLEAELATVREDRDNMIGRIRDLEGRLDAFRRSLVQPVVKAPAALSATVTPIRPRLAEVCACGCTLSPIDGFCGTCLEYRWSKS